jgi:hypothetical protein
LLVVLPPFHTTKKKKKKKKKKKNEESDRTTCDVEAAFTEEDKAVKECSTRSSLLSLESSWFSAPDEGATAGAAYMPWKCKSQKKTLQKPKEY